MLALRPLRCIKKNSFLIRDYATKRSNEVKISFPEGTFKLHKLEKGPPSFSMTNRAELMDYFREMSTIRQLELASDSLYKQRHVRGFLHLYTGQEAVLSGMESALTPEDSVVTAYRDHGFMITRRCGGSVKEVLAELTGCYDGCARGKGGSMHMYKKKSNFYGGNGIVGAQVPLGTGLAFANKYKNNGRVSVTYMGDGAANQGQVYEAFNMAALWKLPAIFVIENNEYGMGTSINRASANLDFYTRGDYIPGVFVDGMDVLAVKETAKFAVDFASSGNGPIVIEAKTYRYFGHSVSDPGTSYRDRSEVQQVREKHDAIEFVKHLLLSHNLATEDDIDNVTNEVKSIIKEGVQYALESNPPQPKELFTQVYVEPTPVRAVELCKSYVP